MPMEQLAWQNRFVRELVQSLNSYSEADCEGKTPQTISGPDNLVILRVSLEEWEKLYSSVYTGADICYPSESDDVRWILNRAVECPVDLCELVANAIATCEDVQDAIAGAILENEDIRRALETSPALGAPMGEAQLNAPLNADSGCDLDVVFAQITGIVDQMDTNNRDFLEIMAVASTPGKRLAQVITAIPVLETLPVDDVIAYVSKIYDEIVANYNAQWTTAVRDEYRCALFCIARDKPDCQLSYDDVFNYINSRLENAVNVGNLVGSVVQYTILGTWSGTTVVDIMMLNQIAIWRAAGNWLGLNLRSLQAVTQLSGNIPDSDWTLLCTDCPETLEWEVSVEPTSGIPVEYYGDITTQTETHLEADAVLYLGIYRLKLHASMMARLDNVSYTAVTYFDNPGGLFIPMPADDNEQQDVFMASFDPFSLSMDFAPA